MTLDITTMPKLGFGLMRLPEKDGRIDIAKVCEMADRYLEAGFNYFDTAYVYHGGNSEKIIKEVLVNRHPREEFTVASKLPAWCIHSLDDRDKIFEEQLERTGLEFFDYYLLHSLEDGINYDTYEKFDCFNWGIQKRNEGKIKHFGFSFHGTPELLENVLNLHPEIEFVQIQLNYADWDNPVVCSGRLYEILHSRGIPMIVMEPVKGGTLAKLPDELEAMCKAVRPEKSIASWAMRFCGSLDGVATILSGMSTQEQVEDNLKNFVYFEPLSGKERDTVAQVTQKLLDAKLIGCTACRYCCDGCPADIHIPDIINALNMHRRFPEDMRPKFFYGSLVSYSGKASACMECGQCEDVCPQHLPIRELMREAVAELEA